MISFEVFAAKDPESSALQGVLMSVPVNCGLSHADTLVLHGPQLLAMEKGRVLPIDFPPLDLKNQEDFEETLKTAGVIAIAEFNALGISDSYLLKLESGAEHGARNADGGQ